MRSYFEQFCVNTFVNLDERYKFLDKTKSEKK